MMIVFISALSLLGLTLCKQQSQATIYTGQVPYTDSLPCFPCISNDYIYCTEGGLRSRSVADGVCCETYDSCAQVTNSSWTCSSSFVDKVLSMNLCPLASCGNQDAVAFKKEGQKESLKMELEPGQACAYSVRS